MVASQLRASARESLTGKWGKAALITLVYTLITFVISFVLNFIPMVGYIAAFVISLPLSYGLIVSFMKLKRGEDVEYTSFLSEGFSNFGKVWGVFGNIILKMILPICLVVIFIIIMIVGMGASAVSMLALDSSSGMAGFGILGIVGLIGYIASLIYTIIKGYLYALAYMILYDNQDMSGKEIVEKSAELMNGHRWSYFWLGLTFIGWAILTIFTLYIGMLWLMPYMMVATICFYEDRAGKLNSSTVIETKTEEKSEEE